MCKTVILAAFILASILAICQPGALAQNVTGDFPFFVFPAVSNDQLTVTPTSTYGPAVSTLIGGDLLTNSDITISGISSALTTIGYGALRYPQGDAGNCWHYSLNSNAGACSSTSPCNFTTNANSTQANYITLLGSRLGHLVANEATNNACNAGNTTADVTGMINYIISTLGCPDTQCKYWTVDNEQYNSGALTLSCTPNSNASCYATQYGTFRTAMLGQDGNIKVCLDADPQHSGPQGSTWDATVMAQTFDCADAHYYWTSPGQETDAAAVTAPQSTKTPQPNGCGVLSCAPGFTGFVNQLKTDIAASSSTSAQIVIGEYSTIPSNYSYQTESIIQSIFNAGVVGEAAQDGVTLLEFHAAVANCQQPPSRGLYGSWLTFTGSMSVSNGATGSGAGTCNFTGDTQQPAAGTILPPGNGLEVAATWLASAKEIIHSTLTSGNSDLVVYSACTTATAGACNANGPVSLMFINRSQFNLHNVTVTVTGHGSGTGGNIVTYQKTLFDQSQSGSWPGPTTTTLSSWNPTFVVTVPPWSIVSVQSG